MQPIMIIADLEDQKQIALQRGMVLAAAMGAPVEVTGFVYEYMTDISNSVRGQLKHELLTKKQAWLEAEAKRQAPKGVNYTVRVVWEKSIHDWVIKRSAAKSYFAVIKTAHRSGNFVYTSTDWHLLRQCKAPVLIEADRKWNKARPVLAALDLETKHKSKQALNERILDCAIDIANALDTEVHVVGAITIPTLLRDMDLIDVDEHVMKRRRKLKPVIAKLCEDRNLDSKNVHFKLGAAHKVIPSVANKVKADLVVMGTVGRRGLKGKLLGNTAEQVLTHLRTDVLAVK